MNRGGRPPKLRPTDVEAARIMRKHGYSTADVAHMLGVAVTTLRRYLRGECRQHQDRPA